MRQLFLSLIFLLITAPAFAASGADNFTGTDPDLGTLWDVYNDATASGASMPCQRVSDTADNSSNGDRCVEGFNGYLPAANQYSQFVVVSLSLNSVDLSALVRLQPPADYSTYQCRIQGTGGTTSRIARRDAGVNTTLASESATTWSGGDTVRCEASGTGLTLRRNGASLLTATDATYATGRGGISILDDPASQFATLDDFEAGDLVSGGGTHRTSPMMFQ